MTNGKVPSSGASGTATVYSHGSRSSGGNVGSDDKSSPRKHPMAPMSVMVLPRQQGTSKLGQHGEAARRKEVALARVMPP
jgi:hypothetical protein